MCVNSSDTKSRVYVSYNVKSNSEKLNSKNILSLFSEGLPNGLAFSAVFEEDVIQVEFYSDKLFLLNDYLERQDNCNAKFYAKEFCKFILNTEGNSFLLGLDQVFCDENGLYFIPSLFEKDNDSKPVNMVRSFLNSISDISEQCFSDINDIYAFSCNDDITVSDIIDYIDNCSKDAVAEDEAFEIVRQCPECGMVYENNYVFCMKCGCKLQELKKETEPDLQDADENPYSEDIIAESEERQSLEESIENIDLSKELLFESDDKTEAIEYFNPEKTGVKRIKHLKIKGLKHSAQKNAEDTAEQKAEKSSNTGEENELPAEEEQANVSPEEKDSEMADTASSDTAKSKYGETTLLGFTNFGETAVLNGMSSIFDMPNLIRESTDEKVYISKRIFVIGKSAEKADYVVNNSAVSRVHAEISVVGSEYYITDKGSTNHTYVNHFEIQPNSPKQIFDGDEIMFANENFTFHLQ